MYSAIVEIDLIAQKMTKDPAPSRPPLVGFAGDSRALSVTFPIMRPPDFGAVGLGIDGDEIGACLRPLARAHSATHPSRNRVVGQTSGQWVKPKKTAEGCPRNAASVIGSPLWSTSVNGSPEGARHVLGAVPVEGDPSDSRRHDDQNLPTRMMRIM